MKKGITNVLRRKLSDTQTRLLFLLMVLVIFIILTVGFSSYYTSKEVLKQELNEPQQQMLKINKNYIDEYILDSDQIAVQLALDQNVYQFLTNNGQSSYRNVRTIYNKLTTITQNSSVIKSIYVYNLKEDSFVAIPQGYSSSSANFNDAEWTNVINELKNTPMIVKYRTLPDGAKHKGSNISLFRKVSTQGEAIGLIAINLDEKELFSKLKSSSEPQSNSMQYIVDQNNTILYKTNNHVFDTETVEYVNEKVKNGSLMDISYNNKILLTNQIASRYTGWKYVSVVSQESVLAKSKTIRDVVFTVSLIALVLGGIAIFYIHSVELRPIRRLKELLSVDEQQEYKRDLLYLENIIDDLVIDHKHLSHLINKVKIEAKSKFIYDIYIGKLVNKKEITEKWQTYFAEWNNEAVHLLVVSIDNYPRWRKKVTPNYHPVIKSGMANIISEVLSTHFRVEAVDIGADKMIFIIQPTDEKVGLVNHLRIALTKVEGILKFTVSAGVNRGCVPVKDVKEAMLQAESALQYRLLKGYGKVYMLSEKTEGNTGFLTDEEQLLKSFTRAEPMQQVEMINHLRHRIVKERLHPRQVLHLMKKVKEEVWEEHHKEAAVADFEWETMDIGDISVWLNEIITEKIEKIKKLNESKKYIMCKKMIQYMTDHLNEPIGIPEIAESVGISVSLASQWFKEEIDDTIYGYFTRLRMERAEQLLIDTDKKIADIAVEIGYQHENSFIRKFREYHDMTPGKYRRVNAVMENIEQTAKGGM
ncbi:AraC-type DNA-binding protein [Gracilibacillus ureilyticus]|uniref:AraC-type DNA-binding protein n=1 Tax=Gracilibacillus ureilyticus TaxID=531814 RepID=A0A1H9NIB1_9BACI|nr:AraC family transcriptional regulator [Gracilibacillus ureilyticus]SER35497.1 AraC-type DNA-binding protein [Gracilibacillus ureilyticus]